MALVLLVGIAARASAQPPGEPTRPVAYRMVPHPTSGVDMPRISLPARPEVETRVNDQLDSLAASLTCEDGEDGSYDTSAVVTWAADDVLSVRVVSSYYCGGAYPTNAADSSLTFDLRTGQAVAFRALFADYGRDAVGVTRAFVRSLPAEDLAGCEDELTVEALDGHFFSYTISGEGLRVGTSFPHVIQACNREAIVPFDELRPFAASGSILTRLADPPD